MWNRFKRAYRQFKRDEPGRRFVNAHERSREHTRGSVATGVILVVAGVLMVGGLLLGLIPGLPGVVPALFGVALIAARFRRVAIWLDWLETKARRIWRRRRRSPRERAPPAHFVNGWKFRPFGPKSAWAPDRLLLNRGLRKILLPTAGGGRNSRSMKRPSAHRYELVLVAIFGVLWTVLAIQPNDRGAWWLENALAIAAVVAMAAFYRRLRFSGVSYTLIFIFMCLHQVGAHYTYSEVPYDRWWEALAGRPFNSLVGWERNNFDRVVHFAYGLLLAYPIREVFLRVADVRGFWGYFLPLDLTMSTSMIFELLEWAAAAAFGGDLGQAYLGTQGDIWDSHKDMALASAGALIAMGLNAAINWRLQRDFAREWLESLRVKHPAPLGEEEIVRMTRA